MARLTHFLLASEWRAAFISSFLLFLPLLSWLGPSVVALFVLRRGVWPIPAIVLFPFAVSIAMGIVFEEPTIAVVLGVTIILATVLHHTLSWLMVLKFAFAISLTLVFFTGKFYEETLQNLVAAIKKVILANRDLKALGVDEVIIDAYMASFAIGALSFVYMVSSFCALAFARAAQAQAFNPGGFKAEFEKILLSPGFAGICLTFAVVGLVTDPWMLRLTPVSFLPLIFAGMALVHGLSGIRKSKAVLLIFYAALLFFTPYLLLLLGLFAAIDTLVDFRQRARKEIPLKEDK